MSKRSSPTVIWFRQDLRLADHSALQAAIAAGGPVIPVYIWGPDEEGGWAPGGASRWWLHHSLERLSADLEERGSRLTIRRGSALRVLRRLAAESGAGGVFWSRRYEPAAIERDAEIKRELRGDGLEARSFSGALLTEPWAVATKAGTPFKVFTPFWRNLQDGRDFGAPMPAPVRLAAPAGWPASDDLETLGLLPRVDWAQGIAAAWRPGAAGAAEVLTDFVDEAADAYGRQRDFPGTRGTSRMSPYLHFGEISPRMVWNTLQERMAEDVRPGLVRGGEAWLRQLAWREFAHHLLYHFPHTDRQPLRSEFEDFPWEDSPDALRAWQRGQTGFPIVDAGMRELWATGWMHNRVRMIVASFLVKDLLIPWQRGAEWFWDTLVDADLANNTMGWQWTAGCGADASPFFRIFNPMSQAERFDGDGDYVRRWVPELAALPNRYLNQPWEAPPEVLRQSGVSPGSTYPRAMVDHAEARQRALEALHSLPGSAGGG